MIKIIVKIFKYELSGKVTATTYVQDLSMRHDHLHERTDG